MLQRISKFSPFVALAAMGYLAYSTISGNLPRSAEGKEPPHVTKAMLNVKFLAPEKHASPTDRDPFEVTWSSYLKGEPASRPATAPASQPTSRPTSMPSAPETPPLPGALEGLFIGEEIRLAVIGEKLYKPGALIGGNDPTRCWVVEKVEQDFVILKFGPELRVLHMSRGGATSGPAKPGGEKRP